MDTALNCRNKSGPLFTKSMLSVSVFNQPYYSLTAMVIIVKLQKGIIEEHALCTELKFSLGWEDQ